MVEVLKPILAFLYFIFFFLFLRSRKKKLQKVKKITTEDPLTYYAFGDAIRPEGCQNNQTESNPSESEWYDHKE